MKKTVLFLMLFVTAMVKAQVSIPVEYLVVAAGGGGASGGGGGGGVLTGSGFVVTKNTPLVVTVGAGGLAGSGALRGSSGGNSSFATVIANGGGGGGALAGILPLNGGCGGGGGWDQPAITAALGIAGQGFSGGLSNRAGYGGGGGGGGAGATGANATTITATSGRGGNGGVGISSSLSGTATFYGGGGGGGINDNSGTNITNGGGTGGNGGGGNGSSFGTNITGIQFNGTAGAANTGGGGGGTDCESSVAGAGGSGIVIIRYAGAPVATGGTITQGGGYTMHTFTGAGVYAFTYVPSANADLSALAISSGTLSPVFSSLVTGYVATVSNATTSITVTPTRSDVNASIKVNGTTVASGTASGAIALSIGANVITTEVTAQDGTIKTYITTVTRLASSNANLSALVVSGATLSPVFTPGTIAYTANVSFATTSITVTPTLADATASITVNGSIVLNAGVSGAISLSIGANIVTTIVTAQDGTLKTYTVIITRLAASVNANLSALVVSGATLSSAFASATVAYTSSVSNATASVTVTPTVADATASITVNGVAIVSGAASGSIALSVGANVITTIVTAQSGAIKTYVITITRTASANANLSALVVTGATLSPVFASATVAYASSVANATASVTVRPTTADATASVTVNGVAVVSGNLSGTISLNVGANVITTIVTAQNGTIKTYVVTITRAASANANLSAFVVSNATLSPAFASIITIYTADVVNATGSITITPTTADATATVTVNGVAVVSGNASGSIALSVGANVINTIVTAQNGTIRTYTLIITREASANADLSGLIVAGATLSPLFASATLEYSLTVSNATTDITVSPELADATASVTVNGLAVLSGDPSDPISLSVGVNVVTIIVTAQDGTIKIYIITITRVASSDADLISLDLSSGTLLPVFAAANTTYTASVANAVADVTVTPMVSDAAATITVNGVAVNSGNASGSIALAVGANVITTEVTAEDGTVKTYTVTITRAASSNADLVLLSLSSGTLSPVFASGTITYTAGVANAVTDITLTPTVSDATATIIVNGVAVNSGDASGSIALSVGANVITTEVTAQDGSIKTYTVTITRAASADADLISLSLSSGTLSPIFASGTIAYTASVATAVTDVTLTPTVSDATATITVNGVAVNSGDAFGAIALSIGLNTITVIVTAQDGTVKTYTVIITRTCTAPSAPSAPGTTICPGNNAVLSATGSGSIGWYDAASGGNYLGGGNSFTTPALVSTTVYYVQDSTCAASTRTMVTVTTGPKIWIGGTGNWNVGSNWCGGIIPASGDEIIIAAGNPQLNIDFSLTGTLTISGTGALTVRPGRTFTVAAGGEADFGGNHVTFNSDITGTASLGKTSGTLNGATNVTVERYIPGNPFRSWRLLSVPVSGSQTFKQAWQEGNAPLQNSLPGYGTQITSTGSLATVQNAGFDNATPNNSLLFHTGSTWGGLSSTNLPMQTRNGYFMYIRGDRSRGISNNVDNNTSPTILRTTGTLYQGNQTSPSIPAGTFGVVGNLYPSAIDFSQLILNGGVDNIFYIWDSKKKSGTSLGVYQTFSAVNGYVCPIDGGSYTLGAANTTIESGQAFMVHATGTGSVTLTEDSKIGGSANLGLRPMTPANELVKIDTRLYATNAGTSELTDATVVVFDDAYSNAVDGNDALKMNNPGENIAILRNTKMLAIEGRKKVNTADTIQFKLWNLTAKPYALEFKTLNLANTGLMATLEDAYLHSSTAVDLATGNTVNFTVDANPSSSAADRFRLVFKQASVLPVSLISISANRSAAGVKVNWKVAAENAVNRYEVQRSTDGRSFNAAGTIAATANSASEKSYDFTDATAPYVTLFYRVKSVGTNGEATFTSIAKVAVGSVQPDIAVMPNPLEGGVVNLQLKNQPKGKYAVRVMSNNGQVILATTVNHGGGNSVQSMQLSNVLPGSTYQLEVVSPDNSKQTQTLFISSKN